MEKNRDDGDIDFKQLFLTLKQNKGLFFSIVVLVMIMGLFSKKNLSYHYYAEITLPEIQQGTHSIVFSDSQTLNHIQANLQTALPSNVIDDFKIKPEHDGGHFVISALIEGKSNVDLLSNAIAKLSQQTADQDPFFSKKIQNSFMLSSAQPLSSAVLSEQKDNLQQLRRLQSRLPNVIKNPDTQSDVQVAIQSEIQKIQSEMNDSSLDRAASFQYIPLSVLRMSAYPSLASYFSCGNLFLDWLILGIGFGIIGVYVRLALSEHLLKREA